MLIVSTRIVQRGAISTRVAITIGGATSAVGLVYGGTVRQIAGRIGAAPVVVVCVAV